MFADMSKNHEDWRISDDMTPSSEFFHSRIVVLRNDDIAITMADNANKLIEAIVYTYCKVYMCNRC